MNGLPPEPRLVVVTGLMSGEVYPLAGGAVTLGRDPDNTICVPDAALSRHHCVFRDDGGGWSLQDLSSSNGTFVNGVQISMHRLTEGDRIAAGGCVLIFVQSAAPARNVDVVDADVLAVTATLAANNTVYLKPPSAAVPSRVEQGLRALLAISTVINAVRSESELRHELLRVLRAIVPAEGAAIIVTRPDGEVDVVDGGGAGGNQPLEVSRTLVQRVLAGRTGVLSHDAAVSRTFAPERPSLGSVRSLLCVPMVLRETALGAFYLVSAARAAFDDDHLHIVTAVASIAAIAMDNVRHLATVEREAERLHADLHLGHNLVGDSVRMKRAYELLGRVARTDTTVLVTGETGTGKELAARTIHLNSARARRPFVAVNCAALVETLVESELFGHERGAFSGAVAQKKGRLELADTGTLFLDEIGELAPSLQSKLLRALQEREFDRVGGTRPVKVDIRLVAATNRNLADEVRAGRFRQDLYFRLNVVRIDMPPLRERRSDIPSLARHFLAKYAQKGGRRVSGISDAALACLQAYGWPGNVRELENAIERAAVLGSAAHILPEDLPEDIVDAGVGPEAPAGSESFHAAVLQTKKTVIARALDSANGSYTEAARALGVHPNYLHRLARNLGLRGDG
jgi:transcriptional regulator with GAF, ATPase, and Fis domain